MQYDFVLRDVDPKIGAPLAALVGILSDKPTDFDEEDLLAAMKTLLERFAGYPIDRVADESITENKRRSWTRISEGATRLVNAIDDHHFFRHNRNGLQDVFEREENINLLDDLTRNVEDQGLGLEEHVPALIWLLGKAQPQFVTYALDFAEPHLEAVLPSLERLLNDLRALPHDFDAASTPEAA